MELQTPITDDTKVTFYNLQYKELDFTLPNELSIRCGDIAPTANTFEELVHSIQNSCDKLSTITGETVTNYEWEIDLS